MSSESSRTCDYINPITREGCQFEALMGPGISSVETNRGRLCMWHLEPEELHAGIVGTPFQLKDRSDLLRRWVDRWGAQGEPINLSGMTFDSIPQEFFLYPGSAITLHDCTIANDLVLDRNHHSIDLHSSFVGGDVVVRQPTSEGVHIWNSRINGSVLLEQNTNSNLTVGRSRVGGSVSIRQCNVPTLDLSRSVFDGGLVVEVKNNMNVFVDGLLLASSSRMRTTGSIKFRGKKLRVRGHLDLKCHGSHKGSSLELSDKSILSGQTTLIGSWSSVNVTDSKIARLQILGGEIQTLNLESSIVDDLAVSETALTAVRLATLNSEGLLDFAYTDIDLFLLLNTRANVLNMRNAVVNELVRFDKVTKIDRLDFRSTRTDRRDLGDVRFDGVEIDSLAFNSRRFLGTAHFKNTTFGSAPHFFGATFEESVSFPLDEASYREITEGDSEAYQCLRHAMEAKRNRDLEGVFFSLEKKCALKGMPPFRLDAILSRVYGWSSNYGNSMGRALLSLVIVMLGAAAWYAIVLKVVPPPEVQNEFVRGLNMSLRQTFTPFFQLREKGWGIGWYLGWSCQSIVCVALIAELLVTIRWKFRRG